MAATARALGLSRFTDLSLKPLYPPKPPPPPFSPLLLPPRRSGLSISSAVSCLSGGVSDEFVSIRKSGFDHGFSVIANMLKRIEPLDTSAISKGVSDSAKDSMKQTISTMLGLLPSDQFSVTVQVSTKPLDRLLVSSIITGYTLWNAEYRISLMRNFDMPSVDTSKQMDILNPSENLKENCEKIGNTDGEIVVEDFERSPQVLGDLSPEALDYIQQLQSELSTMKEELKAEKQENIRIESSRGSRNNLLEYLRSLDSDMVIELSQPSCAEVEEIVHQLVQNILRRFFEDENTSVVAADSDIITSENHRDDDNESCRTMGTSRDYLAKLLFWCMLLGHHLRGLENRLQLSCVVGLL